MTHMPSALPDPDYDAAFYDGVPAKRLFAWMIDVVLITITTVLIGILTFGLGFWLWPVFYLMTSFAYRSLTISAASATLGMRLMNIELRNAKGARLNQSEAVWHTGTYLAASLFVIIQLISAYLIVSTPRHRGLHDRFLGTAMINRPG